MVAAEAVLLLIIEVKINYIFFVTLYNYEIEVVSLVQVCPSNSRKQQLRYLIISNQGVLQ